MSFKTRFQTPERAIRLIFWVFTAACLLAAFLMPDRTEMLRGLVRICTQSGQTVKSYFDSSYGGFGGTFLNAALVCAVCLGLFCLPGSKPDGVSVLAFFLTAGFCFWGRTNPNIRFSLTDVVRNFVRLIVCERLVGVSAVILFLFGVESFVVEYLLFQ